MNATSARKYKAKSVVAKHWAHREDRDVVLPNFVDYGEPSCMACGYWREDWDSPSTIAAKWNSTSLEVCHIVARQFGGTEDLDNLILMCPTCHRDSPDVNDGGEAMRQWLASPHLKGIRGELVRIMRERSDLQDIAAIYETLDYQDVIKETARRSGQHGGRVSTSTWLYAFIGAVFHLHEQRAGVAA